MIEFDIETTGLQWYAEDVFLVAFKQDNDDPVLFKHPQDREQIQFWLNLGDDYRAWNSKFDLHFLKAVGYDLPPEDTWHDGMVLAHICDERSSVALKIRGEKLFGPGERDEEGLVAGWLKQETKDRRKAAKEAGTELVRPNYSDVPEEIMLPYAEQDVVLQRKVCTPYERQLDRVEELKSVYTLERGVLGALFHMEDRGVPIDRNAAVRFEAQLLEDMERLHDEAVDLAGVSHFNPKSSDQIAEALERHGADLTFVARSEKTKKLSMDEENLSAVDHPLAEKILEFRGTARIFDNYINPMLHPTDTSKGIRHAYLTDANRIHPNFRQVGARTGRMSCSDPNIQNWHRDDLRLRHLVTAEEGKVLVTADLDAIEARILAAYAGDGDLKRLLTDPDGDIHTHTARAVGLRERQRGGGVVESVRQRGKTFNYLMMFGGGVRSIRKTFRVSQAEARAMKQRYEDAYPEIVELSNRIEFSLVDRGFVKTAWGRRQRPYGTKPWEIEREAYKFTNYIVQGTAADLLKEALVRCHKAGLPMIFAVHDELGAMVDREYAQEASDIITEAMIDHPKIAEKIPLRAEAQIVERWSHAKEPDYTPGYLSGSAAA